MANLKNPKDLLRVVMTIGHGTRTIEEFIAALKAFGVTRVVDVRKMPRSATNPQFNYETLPADLDKAGISYTHMLGLTGLRKQSKVTLKTAWRNKSFRAFAAYMQTPEFEESIDQLVSLAKSDVPALMCAETLPWRCHRSLIGDALVARGIAVQDIFTPTKASVHVLPGFAKLAGDQVTYPPEEEEADEDRDEKPTRTKKKGA